MATRHRRHNRPRSCRHPQRRHTPSHSSPHPWRILVPWLFRLVHVLTTYSARLATYRWPHVAAALSTVSFFPPRSAMSWTRRAASTANPRATLMGLSFVHAFPTAPRHHRHHRPPLHPCLPVPPHPPRRRVKTPPHRLPLYQPPPRPCHHQLLACPPQPSLMPVRAQQLRTGA